MVAKRKKKYSSGEGSLYMSRNAALKFLQLSLADFRKLCIIKGIYPREPRKRKVAQQGASGVKTLYLKKDIQFLMHEPIIWKLRDYKVFERKVGRARALSDFQALRRHLQNRPYLTLDTIVKERYPSFIDAIRDLDDCLTLIFLFSTFPKLQRIPRYQSALCRRLSVEFLHAIIAARALRKVFVSIKGYYFQADIKGQTVTWIVPHHFSFVPQFILEVDFRIMSTFVEFYSVMLGFVNFRLYHSLNLYYPPKFAVFSADDTEKTLVDKKALVAERIEALTVPILRTGPNPNEEEDVEIDQFQMDGDKTKMEEARQEALKVKKLKTLFEGLKFFINREVPREILVFIIRCFGGEVSWDKLLFVGATFDEHDESITHQVVDRPVVGRQYISRSYVQPQWVFDSVNARELLPVEKYFIGAVLPPHLSPFVDKTKQRYIPPEEKALEDPSLAQNESDEDLEFEDEHKITKILKNKREENEEQSSDDDDDDDGSDEEKEDTIETLKKENLKKQKQLKKAMSVSKGAIAPEDPNEKKNQDFQERRLREMMIKKKHRRLYRSMMQGRKKRGKEVWLLERKRKRIEAMDKAERKGAKKQKYLELLGEPSGT